MSSNNKSNNNNDDDDERRERKIRPDTGPEFRFVQMQRDEQQSATTETNNSVIDKSAFFSSQQPPSAHQPDQQPMRRHSSSSLWNPTELRTVPAFYPLEKSSRLVEDDTPSNVAARLADCLRRCSIQAVYENDTAHLHSADHVDMHLSLWRTPPTSPQRGIVVELQRRSGDSIAFHRYARSILDAAMGLLAFDEGDASSTNNNSQHDVPLDNTATYSKRVQRLLRSVSHGREEEEHETALQAIEIAHGLLMKDRMDAQVLGLESLCLLTDPAKAGTITSVLTAHVVLLGSTQNVQDDVQLPTTASASGSSGSAPFSTTDEGPFVEIRESILNLVQFSRIGQPDDDDDDASVTTDPPADDEQHLKLLHHLALAVLANALNVLERPPRQNRTRTRSADIVADQFVGTILPTLVSELGQAQSFPHAATLSAKCLGSLVRASAAARQRAKELGAKQVVQTALDVGTATHLRLQLESQKLSQTLAEEPVTTGTEEEGKQEEPSQEELQENEDRSRTTHDDDQA